MQRPFLPGVLEGRADVVRGLAVEYEEAVELILGEAEPESLRKAPDVALDRLVEHLGLHAVQAREVAVQNGLLASKHVYQRPDFRGGRVAAHSPAPIATTSFVESPMAPHFKNRDASASKTFYSEPGCPPPGTTDAHLLARTMLR